MSRTDVAVTIAAPIDDVWQRLADIDDHTNWMIDADEIIFDSERRQGLGTAFRCITRIGPLRLTDRLEIIGWEPPRRFGVRHTGIVLGDGWFTLAPLAPDRTRFTWSESVHLRWWLGGRIGWAIARPVMRRVWRHNLRRFAAGFDG